jgi:hypothetical protein
MTCVRCEVVRAKIIATGLGGLRKTGAEIVKDLQGRYGDVYQLKGLRVVRASQSGDILIYEARR